VPLALPGKDRLEKRDYSEVKDEKPEDGSYS
jgi:hypothetical protein